MPAAAPRLRPWPYVLAVIWLALTLSLASWWLIFLLMQVHQLATIGGIEPARIDRVHLMLVGEGGFFIALLGAGGATLIWAIRREQRRRHEVQSFFMAFTHDLKTRLASLQLQAESLREDLPDAAGNPNLDRLLKDALQLQLQLENSLYFAGPEGRLLDEAVDLPPLVSRTAADWPELRVEVTGAGRARADSRALEGVLRNLFQNAVVHGEASAVSVDIARRSGRVAVTVTDDGRGVGPDVLQQLGRPFARPAATSGTGVGLFVSRQLVERMAGRLEYGAGAHGFRVVLDLQEAG